MFPKDNRKKVVFLGTPDVAALVLNIFMQRVSHSLKIILAITQPPSRSSRKQEDIPSPVHIAALKHGIPVFTPQSIKDENFLTELAALEPDLCITAAYGNYLPENFLKIPKYGTVNIHPSLLPLYRGAAPVQRSIENGDTITGVTILYTIKAMDAGPIIAQETHPLNQDIKAQELLETLFKLGAEVLIKNLKHIFSPDFIKREQEHQKATYAKKLSIEESLLDFNLPAVVLHNKVRAFSIWPGTKVFFQSSETQIECKIITTQVEENSKNLKPQDVFLNKDSIDICCGDNKVLKIIEIQPAGKKILCAKAFQNGLKTKNLSLLKYLPHK